MSFDLMLLDPDTAPTIEQIYDLAEAAEPDAPLSPRMRALIDECHARWPGQDAAGNWTDAPWASWPLTFDPGPVVIEVNIQWEHANHMLAEILEAARRHGVVLFEPQTSTIHLPPRLR